MPQTISASCLRERGAPCRRCIDLCPCQAIDVAPGLQQDLAKCNDCGLCSTACPMGVFVKRDRQLRLFESLSLLSNPTRLLLVCPCAEKQIPTDYDAAIALECCPLELDLSIHCALPYWHVKQVGWLTGNCSTCGTVDGSGRIRELSACLQGLMPTVYGKVSAQQIAPLASKKPPLLIDPQKSQVARRAFFGVVKRKVRRQTFPSSLMAAVAAVQETLNMPEIEEGSPLFLRCLLLAALDAAGGEPQTKLPTHFPIYNLTVADQCWACGACARACPSRALAYRQQDDRYVLSFRPALCLGCGLCSKVCRSGALQVRPEAITLHAFCRQPPEVLSSGVSHSCKRCQASFAKLSDSGLCPFCERVGVAS